MKKILLSFLFVAALLSYGCAPQSASVVAADAANSAVIRAKADQRDFTIDANRMIALGSVTKDLNTPYYVTINGNEVISHLPFIGTATKISTNEGLIFDGTISNYRVSIDRKNQVNVKFQTSSMEDEYVFTIYIAPNGEAGIYITARERSPISFDGTLRNEEH